MKRLVWAVALLLEREGGRARWTHSIALTWTGARRLAEHYERRGHQARVVHLGEHAPTG